MIKIGDVSLVYPADAEVLQFPWGTIRFLASPGATGARGLSFGIVRAEPGPGHSLHSHDEAEEIIYVLEGEGELIVEGHDPVPLAPGGSIFIPPGAKHSTRNTGTGVFTTLIVYSPPGPEESLKADPECSVFPPG